MNFKKAFKISIIIGLMLVMVTGVMGAGRGDVGSGTPVALKAEGETCSSSSQCDYGLGCRSLVIGGSKKCYSSSLFSCTTDADCSSALNVGTASISCQEGRCKHTKAKGIVHYGADIQEGDKIKVGGSTLEGVLADLRDRIINVDLVWSKADIKTSYGSLFFKKPKEIGTIVKGAVDKDVANEIAATNIYVERSAYSGYSTYAKYSGNAEYTNYAGLAGVCSLVGIEDCGGSSCVELFGSKASCGQNEFNKNKEASDKMTIVDNVARMSTSTGISRDNTRIVYHYCCLPKGSKPDIKYAFIGYTFESKGKFYDVQANKMFVAVNQLTPIKECKITDPDGSEIMGYKSYSLKEGSTGSKCNTILDVDAGEDCYLFENINYAKMALTGQYTISCKSSFGGKQSSIIAYGIAPPQCAGQKILSDTGKCYSGKFCPSGYYGQAYSNKCHRCDPPKTLQYGGAGKTVAIGCS